MSLTCTLVSSMALDCSECKQLIKWVFSICWWSLNEH